ncbi:MULTISPECIES: TerD family protein [Protofrankia]|uniref:Tellurium resistance n=1 Tax=Candidatus Protofrankia datiscae TaxID=2716812 RepID=F8B562_9ACTN|nr:MULTISPECIES: Tellurium resistance [Protofrankia]AEH11088.1 Tellurium resistance [Candidatus Protofrankia datiscae]
MSIDYTKRSTDSSADSSSGSSAGSPSGTPGVSLNKVTLTKSSPSVSLSKQGGGGRLHVNLNWNAQGAAGAGGRGGLLKRVLSAGQGGIDLDLASLYELADGRKGVVQALGNAFGSFETPPYVQLDADDRTGASTGGENLFVNLAHVSEIRRLLIFAFVYSGVPNFDQAGAVVTLTPARGVPIEVRLDERAGSARMCAIALLTNQGGNDLIVNREVRYVGGHQELDRAFGWGLNWTPGRK